MVQFGTIYTSAMHSLAFIVTENHVVTAKYVEVNIVDG